MSKRKRKGDFDLSDIDFSAGLDVPAFGGGDEELPPDPLAGLVPTGDVGEDSKQEVSALLQAFRDRNAQEQKRFVNATDSEYWFCVCFRTRDEKEEFLRRFGLDELGDKYLDGERVAAKLRSRPA